MIYLTNTGSTPMPLYLNADDFVSSVTKETLGAVVTFAAAGSTTSARVYQATVAPGATLAVTVEVANVWQAGESTAPLLNGNAQIATLRAVKSRVPLNVRVLGAGETPAVLAFQNGVARDVVLRNDDPMTYHADWRLTLGAASVAGTVTLPQNGVGTLAITPPRAWFSAPVESFFKDEVKDGTLVLAFGQQEQVLPVRARLTYWPASGWRLISGAVIFLVLLAGGLCSLLLNQWFPNRLKRLALDELLGDVAARTRNLSSRIESGPRILVRVERFRLLQVLNSRWVFSPEMADVLVAGAHGITRLEAKVTLLERIDAVLGDLARLRLVAPPTLADAVEERLRTAIDRLRASQPTDPGLDDATALVREAAAKLVAINQSDGVFVTELIRRFEDLRAAFDRATGLRKPDGKGAAIAAELPALFAYLDGPAPPPSLRPDGYFEHDLQLLRLALLREYLELHAQQSPGGRARLNKEEPEFLACVGALTCEKYGEARLILREMYEEIYADEVEHEIQTRQMRIVPQPVDPRPHQAVELSARFKREAFNVCAARGEYTCQWTFDHVDSEGRPTRWQETGWAVHHFFPKPAKYPVTVSFRRKDGTEVADQTQVVVEVTDSVLVGHDNVARLGSRTWIEGVRFGIVLIATVVGLLGGAREQLMKLDVAAGLVAVFLIGFGADAVKNILVDRGTAPPAPRKEP